MPSIQATNTVFFMEMRNTRKQYQQILVGYPKYGLTKCYELTRKVRGVNSEDVAS